jgi:drug/metabolite transporter (DMT)-like permease
MAILWAVAFFSKQVVPTIRQWRNRQAFPAIIAGTVTGPFLGIWLSMIAIQLAPVGVAATLMALPPILLIPLSRIFFDERITRRAIFGTVVAMAGTAVILGPG